MKAIELQPKRSTYNPSPLGKNNNNIRKSGTARLSRSDSKNHVDDAALASVSYDLEVQKLQEEEKKGSNTFFARICSNIGNKIWENTPVSCTHITPPSLLLSSTLLSATP